MAQFNYARTRSTAERLIERFGQTGALRRTTSDNDPFNPSQTTTDHDCAFAVLDYSKSVVDGTVIQQNDQMVYLSTKGLTIAPETTDRLVVGGTALTIVSVKPLSPAGMTIFYELQVRK
jgi:hypothetical protein